MMASPIPPKVASALCTAIARSTIYKDVSVSAAEMMDGLLAPAGVSAAAGVEMIATSQAVLAIAAASSLTVGDFAAVLEKSSLPPALRDALADYWRANRETVRTFLAAAASAAAGRPSLAGLRWRLSTPTAAEVSADSTGALADAAPTVTLELQIAEPSPSSGGESQRVVSVSASKAQLQDMIASLEAARREIEKAASEGAV